VAAVAVPAVAATAAAAVETAAVTDLTRSDPLVAKTLALGQ